MSKETLSKRKKKNLEKKYIRRRIGVVLIAIVALVFLGTRIALNHKVEVAKGNTGDEGENKELVMEEATVELPQYKSTDIVPGRNVTFDGKNYAINVKDVSKMVEGSYEGNENLKVYNILRTKSDYNSGYYSELTNILEQSSNSQKSGLLNGKPLSIIVNDNAFTKEQESLKKLTLDNKVQIINAKNKTDVIPLEKPELFLDSIRFIQDNSLEEQN